MINKRCCPELVQFYRFRSVEVLLDTPPGSPKNCQEARGGSVRVQISLSRPVSFFMLKPRIPLLGSWIMAGGRLANAECLDDIAKLWIVSVPSDLVPGGFKETHYSLDRKDSDRRGHGLWLSDYTMEDRILPIVKEEPNVTRARGCKAFSIKSARCVSGRTGGVNFMTLTGLSLARHVAFPDHGVGLDGRFGGVTPPPRLARAALSANGLSSVSSTSADILPNCDLLVDAHWRLTGEVFLLRSQV
ncbi:hypothetical protein F2Q69_00005802 [Brassica cretica]|uniref:Uncharacterized protein n=1 Tax=Brassica cretica TaxID=69181 RepID=A0A8S9PFC8_BRACR|nr:hypothetical protein F2Q69_00005802 [Brassica cretica]